MENKSRACNAVNGAGRPAKEKNTEEREKERGG